MMYSFELKYSKELKQLKPSNNNNVKELQEFLDYILSNGLGKQLRGYFSMYDLILINKIDPKKLSVRIGFTELFSLRQKKDAIVNGDLNELNNTEKELIRKELIRINELLKNPKIRISGFMKSRSIDKIIDVSYHEIVNLLEL